MDEASLSLDSSMELDMSRCRSSTWPLPDPSLAEDGEVKREESESPLPNAIAVKQEPQKKMRNAWGNMSYADLITQAILSSPDKRLTLSEIYEWIVQNVPYFSDKASSPSTAGWKVSVTDVRVVYSVAGRVMWQYSRPCALINWLH